MERRLFIRVTAAGALGISLSGATFLKAPQCHVKLLARPELLTILDRDRVIDIGSSYLAASPEDNAASLASTILSDARLTSSLPEPALHDGVAKQIRRDFARHRTVRLKGWILSVTEARQCALYSILCS